MREKVSLKLVLDKSQMRASNLTTIFISDSIATWFDASFFPILPPSLLSLLCVQNRVGYRRQKDVNPLIKAYAQSNNNKRQSGEATQISTGYELSHIKLSLGKTCFFNIRINKYVGRIWMDRSSISADDFS